MIERFTNSLGEPTSLPYNAHCSMCGREGNHEDLAIKKEDWPERYVNLCWDCYMGKNTENKKGLWLCRLGLHKWHPILSNPKVCYRCRFQWNNTFFRRKGASRFPFTPSWLKFLVEAEQ